MIHKIQTPRCGCHSLVHQRNCQVLYKPTIGCKPEYIYQVICQKEWTKQGARHLLLKVRIMILFSLVERQILRNSHTFIIKHAIRNRKNVKTSTEKCFIISQKLLILNRYWKNVIQILKVEFSRSIITRTEDKKYMDRYHYEETN